jgi:heterodisulfide reductase subunit B
MPEQSYTYFPGCSLATSARESNQALMDLCSALGISLVELQDWNCCGSSSAHSVNNDLADKLAMRNLALAPAGRPLLVACPSCHLRLRHAQHTLREDPEARRRYKTWFGAEPDDTLEIVHFFELLANQGQTVLNSNGAKPLKGLRCAPYYGCMLARPPVMRREKNYRGLMERILTDLGAEPVTWAYASRCCGTFLSVVRPDVVTPIVQQILNDAILRKAECVVTACAMCHLNLELRCDQQTRLPIFHFAELLVLALGNSRAESMFERHLIDPRPLLAARHL